MISGQQDFFSSNLVGRIFFPPKCSADIFFAPQFSAGFFFPQKKVVFTLQNVFISTLWLLQ